MQACREKKDKGPSQSREGRRPVCNRRGDWEKWLHKRWVTKKKEGVGNPKLLGGQKRKKGKDQNEIKFKRTPNEIKGNQRSSFNTSRNRGGIALFS